MSNNPSLEYRRRTCRRILIALAIFGIICLIMVAVTGCTNLKSRIQAAGALVHLAAISTPDSISEITRLNDSMGPTMESYIEEIRRATPAVSNRATDGKFKIALCPLCGRPPIDHWEGWHRENSHQFETPTLPIKSK